MPPRLSNVAFGCEYEDRANAEAAEIAKRLGCAEPNLEDRLRAALRLIGGLRSLGDPRADDWREYSTAASEGSRTALIVWPVTQ